MLTRVFSSAVIGIEACRVEVEVDISRGLPSYTTVGLAEVSVKESRDRVKAAIVNSGFRFPDDRITVNLAPAGMKKVGTGFDLPVALGILSACGVVSAETLGRFLVLGELSLDGRVRPVGGVLSMALSARSGGYAGILIPQDNRHEAAIVEGLAVFAVDNLSQAVNFLNDQTRLSPVTVDCRRLFAGDARMADDYSEVTGQEHARRALEIAAAGGHNLIMIGPPGAGKTMLAKRLPTILPDMTFEEAVETTRIYSVAGLLESGQALVVRRPFRAPHHNISDAGLIGGGGNPRPGEVSLAHNGVLFLDEFPEFRKSVLEMLRQPVEDKQVTIARVAMTITYPSAFMLVAAMNPCPCGYLGDPRHDCRCPAARVQQYRSRISGPLLDRIDIHLEVPAISYREISAAAAAESSANIKARVVAARQRQSRRFKASRTHNNAQMNNRQIKRHCPISRDADELLELAVDRMGISARAYTRILKVARTIADLDNRTDISEEHISEAIQIRGLERTPA